MNLLFAAKAWLFALAGLLGWSMAAAQLPGTATSAPPHNVLHLSASSGVEVMQDWVVMTLAVTREAPDAGTAQAQVKAALEPALTEARKAGAPGQVEIRTGGFSVSPRYVRDGRIGAWVGSAELILSGRDVGRIAQLAGRLPNMSLAGIQFSLSREQRVRAEDEAQQLAIERFKIKAAELAKGFGFAGWSLREVSVQSSDQNQPRAPWAMAQVARAASAEAAVPVEAGKAAVTVIVTGTVQLR